MKNQYSYERPALLGRFFSIGMEKRYDKFILKKNICSDKMIKNRKGNSNEKGCFSKLSDLSV